MLATGRGPVEEETSNPPQQMRTEACLLCHPDAGWRNYAPTVCRSPTRQEASCGLYSTCCGALGSLLPVSRDVPVKGFGWKRTTLGHNPRASSVCTWQQELRGESSRGWRAGQGQKRELCGGAVLACAPRPQDHCLGACAPDRRASWTAWQAPGPASASTPTVMGGVGGHG